MRVRRRGDPPLTETIKPLQFEKPKRLAGYASAHWDAVVPRIAEMIELRSVDAAALEALCLWWGEYRKLQEAEPTDSGEAYKRNIAMASCFKHWSGLAARFGLTPKDREKLSTLKRDWQTNSELQQMLG